MAYWFLSGGLVLLLFGSEAIVRGGVAISRALNVSPLVIGLLVVTAGTSAPEFAVSLEAARTGAADIALANIVGSNILNLLLILGLAAVIRPLPSSPKVVLRDGGAMLLSAVALALVARNGTVSRFQGVAMLAAFAVYVAAIFFSDWRRSAEHSVPCARAVQRPAERRAAIGRGGAVHAALRPGRAHRRRAFRRRGRRGCRAGFPPAAMAGGPHRRRFPAPRCPSSRSPWSPRRAARPISPSAISSAPTCFNTLGALGATAALVPLKVDPALGGDLIAMAAASALIVPLLVSRWRLSRPRGALLVLSYACYLVFLAWRQGLVGLQTIGLS